MIIQKTHRVRKAKINGVIRSFSVGCIEGKQISVVGTQNKSLIILDEHWNPLQIISFEQWVRSLAMGDLDRDGNSEIIAGSGDGVVRIFKYSPKDGLFHLVDKKQYEGFIDSIECRDIDLDGNLEIIVGSWDKNIHILSFDKSEGEGAYKLREIKEIPIEERVKKIKCVDLNQDGMYEIIALLLNSKIIVLSFQNQEAHLLWEFNSESKIEDFDVGFFKEKDIPYIVCGGSGKQILFLNSEGKETYSFAIPEKITRIKIGCVDGGDHNEVLVAGGGKGNLPRSQQHLEKKHIYAFEFESNESDLLVERWSLRIPRTVNVLYVSDIDEDGKLEVVYGGYSQSLYAIQDNYYGQKGKWGIDHRSLYPSPINAVSCVHQPPSVSSDHEDISSLSQSDEETIESRTMEESDQSYKESFSSKDSNGSGSLVESVETENEFIGNINGTVSKKREGSFTRDSKSQASFASKTSETSLQKHQETTTSKASESVSKVEISYEGHDLSTSSGSGFPSKTLDKKEENIEYSSKPSHVGNQESSYFFKAGDYFPKKPILLEKLSLLTGDDSSSELILRKLREKGFVVYQRNAPRGYYFKKDVKKEDIKRFFSL